MVSYKVKEGEETLKRLLESDEGAPYIGEIALLPYKSHISDMKDAKKRERDVGVPFSRFLRKYFRYYLPQTDIILEQGNSALSC